MMQANPGNINYRIGAALMAYEAAIIRGDLIAANNILQGLIYRYAAIHATPTWRKNYLELPKLNDDHAQTDAQAMEALGDQLEACLGLLRDHGVFARRPELEEADSSILDTPPMTSIGVEA